ncbi:HPP-domain-containing protein [Rhizodiscina lignyota]|uniref:HPP-domain-containing protein n=1 Tax=Rhizodiscina lignyota TaxID=1504668 RepID=A0A9P4M7K2_9PEZI|nr:HPP-domain-containing protein [Rhizodiscina lignyota]
MPIPRNILPFAHPVKRPVEAVSTGVVEFKHRIGPWPELVTKLPTSLTRWIGYRKDEAEPEPQYVQYLWPFVGTFCGLAVLQAIFGHAQYFIRRGVPPIIPSYGASAVLCYGAISVPLAQPRALVGGHFIAALVGVILAKIFESHNHPETLWVAGSLATAIAITVMQFTKTTHPPAGATALLAVIDDQIRALSWYYLPVILLSSTIMVVTAMLFNNIQRRYPTFWYKPTLAVAASDAAAGGAPVEEAIDEEKPTNQQAIDQRSDCTVTGDGAV